MDAAGQNEIPPTPAFILSALYNLLYYGAFVVLLHFVARSGLGSQRWFIQLLGVLPITVFLWHWLVPNHGLVQFVGIPILSQLKWPNPRMFMKMLVAASALLVARAALLIALFTETFAAWTGFWYRQGGLATNVGVAGGRAFSVAERFYLWNLADALPSLHIPETLRWSLGPTFVDWRAGVFLLTYKVVVIVPLVYGFVAVLRRLWDEFGTSNKKSSTDGGS